MTSKSQKKCIGNALSCPTKEIQSAINKLMEEKYA